MSDDLFNYFDKGSKKFEPLDDDLDLPEINPPKKESGGSRSAMQETDIDAILRGEVDEDDLTFGGFDKVESSVQPVDESIEAIENKHGEPEFDFSEPPHHDVIEPGTVEVDIAQPTAEANDFEDADEEEDTPETDTAGGFGFGAGLFDEDIVELDAPARLPSVAPAAAKVEPAAEEVVQAVEESAPVTQEPKKKRSALGMIASVLGMGPKEETPAKPEVSATAESKSKSLDDDLFAADEDEGLLSFEPIDPPEKNTPLPSMFQSKASASDFDDDDDPDELIGWGSSTRKIVDDVTPLNEEEDDFDDDLDNVLEDEDDEEFIEFEIEELTSNSKTKPADEHSTRRRRRQPVESDSKLDDSDDEAGLDWGNDGEPTDPPSRPSRSRRRGRGRDRTRDAEPAAKQDSPSTSSSRGRGRGADSSVDDIEVKAQSGNRSKDDDEDRPSRSRSRGRGRGRGEQEREPVAKSRPTRGRGPNRDDRFVDDELFEDEDEVVEDFVEDSVDTDDEVEESKPRRRRRRGRGRGRGRSDGESSEPSRKEVVGDDDFAADDFDRDEDDDDEFADEPVVSDNARPTRGSQRGRGRGRGRSKPVDDRDDDSFESPTHVAVPTWDETIDGLIEANIQKHAGSSQQRRGGGRGNNKSSGGNSNGSNGGGRRRR